MRIHHYPGIGKSHYILCIDNYVRNIIFFLWKAIFCFFIVFSKAAAFLRNRVLCRLTLFSSSYFNLFFHGYGVEEETMI